MITVRSKRFLLFLFAALCTAAVLAAVPSYAYIDRGNVTISDPGTLVLKPGETTSMAIHPFEEAHYPGCQMADCPEICGEKNCIVMVNGQMECTCKGTEFCTYYAEVKPGCSDPSVATVEYDNKGSVIITAVGAGSAQVSVCADFREYKGASKTVNITVVAAENPSGSDDPEAKHKIAIASEEECHAVIKTEVSEAAAGEPVMVKASPSNGYKLNGLVVKDSSGNSLDVKGVGGIYEFTMPAGEVSVSAVTTEVKPEEPKEFPFTDVDANRWSRSSVEYVFNNNLFKGTSDTLFSPELTMTRGMMVTVLYRLEGTPEVSGASGFSDVASGAYYEKAVKWASDRGIVLGTAEGIFSPEDMITREQMVTIMYRYTEYKKYSTEIKGTLQDYSEDNRKISSYAVTPFKWAVTRGIITGVSSTSLDPQGSATREQVAAVMMRYVQKFVK